VLCRFSCAKCSSSNDRGSHACARVAKEAKRKVLDDRAKVFQATDGNNGSILHGYRWRGVISFVHEYGTIVMQTECYVSNRKRPSSSLT
jgi:hypothetical protein